MSCVSSSFFELNDIVNLWSLALLCDNDIFEVLAFWSFYKQWLGFLSAISHLCKESIDDKSL